MLIKSDLYLSDKEMSHLHTNCIVRSLAEHNFLMRLPIPLIPVFAYAIPRIKERNYLVFPVSRFPTIRQILYNLHASDYYNTTQVKADIFTYRSSLGRILVGDDIKYHTMISEVWRHRFTVFRLQSATI